MLQYLIILLDDTSTSFCHYGNPKKERKLMPLDTLRKGIRFGMLENLMIQFVYPDYELPSEQKEAIESIDHNIIISSLCKDETLTEEADIIVCNDWKELSLEKIIEEKIYVLRTTKTDLFERYQSLKGVLSKINRLNIVITDVDTFKDEDIEKYQEVLSAVGNELLTLYSAGKTPKINLLTDRMILEKMNNCGAGDTNITLAPNGKFYICPAFYYEDENDSVGDLDVGLNIKNKQLYKLKYAPICRHCDAYQCKRCIWINKKTTLEVNTPPHEQCVIAHIERNMSRELSLRSDCFQTLGQLSDIKEIKYFDPFDTIDNWDSELLQKELIKFHNENY